jgi:hypothetical protein
MLAELEARPLTASRRLNDATLASGGAELNSGGIQFSFLLYLFQTLSSALSVIFVTIRDE